MRRISRKRIYKELKSLILQMQKANSNNGFILHNQKHKQFSKPTTHNTRIIALSLVLALHTSHSITRTICFPH